jgi:hypothetical protein
MNEFQRVIKYLAIGFATFLTIVIISAIAGLVSGIVSMVTGEHLFGGHGGRIDFSEEFSDVEALKVDNSAGDLIIKTGGDVFKVEAANVRKSFSAEVTRDKTLVVKDRRTFLFNFGFSGATITIYLPENFVAKEVILDTGAGTVSIDGLKARKLEIDAGAGNITGSGIEAEKALIDGGVGNISFTGTSFKDVDFNSGVGNLDFEGAIDGDCEIDCGVGRVDFELDARRDDYSFDIDNGLGAVRVNGEKIPKEYKSKGNTGKTIKIDGGVGDVIIDFKN